MALAYFFGFSPYEVIHNDKQDNYCLTELKWRKGITAVVSLMSTMYSFAAMKYAFSQVNLRSPAIIFGVAPEVGDGLLCLTIWYVIWFRKSEVALFFSMISPDMSHAWLSSIKTPKSSERQTRKLALSFCALFLILHVTFNVLRLSVIFSNTNLHPLAFLYETLRQILSLGQAQPKNYDEMSNLEVGAVGVFLAFWWYSMFSKAFAVLLCVAAVAVALKNSWELNRFLCTESDQVKVIQTYRKFKDFLEAINQITGPLIFGLAVICAPTFYVANLARVLVQWNLESPITWLTIAIYAFVLVGAAEVTNKTDEFREWIVECGEGAYEEELFCMFIDLTQNPVGICGMECLTVTYGFLAQMLSAVVTFTIILLQFTTV